MTEAGTGWRDYVFFAKDGLGEGDVNLVAETVNARLLNSAGLDLNQHCRTFPDFCGMEPFSTRQPIP